MGATGVGVVIVERNLGELCPLLADDPLRLGDYFGYHLKKIEKDFQNIDSIFWGIICQG